MRILVFSDSHGSDRSIHTMAEAQRDCGAVIFLGDGQNQAALAKTLLPNRPFFTLRGNCDFFPCDAETEQLITLPGITLFAAHGHTLGVKSSLEPLLNRAQNLGVAVALYGHTHIASTSYQDGIYLLNPGSISLPRDSLSPSYGYVDITPTALFCGIVRL